MYMYHASFPLMFLALPLLSLLLFTACQHSRPQTGHQLIAVAVRQLLDTSYAGIDYLTYRDGLRAVEAVVAQQLESTPRSLRTTAEEILAYLRTAEEILRWQAEHGDTQTVDPALVAAWTKRYPFLQAAVGAQTKSVFDVGTALILLWDKANALLPSFQVKSKPL
jgi:hypothetical protein